MSVEHIMLSLLDPSRTDGRTDLEVVIDPLGGQVRGRPHRLPHGRLGLSLLGDDVLARHEVLDEMADVVACMEENRVCVSKIERRYEEGD